MEATIAADFRRAFEDALFPDAAGKLTPEQLQKLERNLRAHGLRIERIPAPTGGPASPFDRPGKSDESHDGA